MIKSGCLVRLKSGGPTMTVKSVYEFENATPSRIFTVWFDNDGREHNSDFREDCLLCLDDGEFLLPKQSV